ncbi:thiamine phosphate synthase [Desulfitobacterium metallireducens]|uniref:Thiamine-phosphate synthase n=1 Tax=Desulfitobacterium metallireducens DSM 15288 TaxID=871968 RepID=W0E5W6_9FIRM|nr:thiamine phosphate synthase [Desulfitobacterium metallireducens]AHF06147.1 thiamine-phosphate pyrophosphorylase [Desulfitobacterium metallireducens DSM 15288]
MNKSDVDYRLYLVTDRETLKGRDLCQSIEHAILGGVTLVQLREKSVSTREFLELALAVKGITTRHGIPLIINDRLDIALAIDADGLHIGQDDLPMPLARKLFGPDKIIGVSAGTLEESLLAEKQGADYLGVGAMVATPTKPEAKIVTFDELKQIKKSVHIPVVAIGGIHEWNARETMSSGIDGISVVSAILAQDDIKSAAQQLLKVIC